MNGEEITFLSKIMEMDWTIITYVIGSAITGCLATVYTILKIKAMNKTEAGNKPGDSPSCRHHSHDLELMRNDIHETQQHQTDLSGEITAISHSLDTQMTAINTRQDHDREENERSLIEIKTEFKNLLYQIDDLLDNLLDTM